MKTRFTLSLDDASATLDLAGGKGAALTRMVLAGFPIPPGFHVTTGAYRLFAAENQLQPRILKALEPVSLSHPPTLEAAAQAIGQLFAQAPIPPEIAEAIVQAYAALPGSSPAVAVRSSATAEDLAKASFAGQQETYLNVSGVQAVLEATRKCWASLWTPRAIGYRARQGILPGEVALAVVVQLLVPAEASGILFTANPLNGRRDQMVVNASWGLGEAVVGGLVTPDSLVLDKSSAKLIGRETAEKFVQTVQLVAGTQEEPVPAKLRRAPVLSDAQASELAQMGAQIEALFGTPVDIEWALANGKFSILQARPITAMAEPEAAPPSDWKLPEGAYSAIRNNIVELMADPLTPLFKTLGLSAVNTSLNGLVSGFLGRSDVLPEGPIIAVNEYAYFNGSVKFGPMLKIILKTRGILKRMFTGAVERWTVEGRPRYIATVDGWQHQDWRQLPATEILGAVRQLSEAATDAYGAMVSGIIPAAWISEGLFTLVYRLLRRRDDPAAPAYLMGFDSLPIRAEKSIYDLAQWARKHTALAAYLNDTPSTQLVAQMEEDQTLSSGNPDDWDEWRMRFQAYLAAYGHMIYNLDFGCSVPADDPAPVLETLKLFLSGQGVNPHERQHQSARRRKAVTKAKLNELKGIRRKAFLTNLQRAQRYAPLREDSLADVGLSYPLLRQMLFELGQRFVKSGMIEKAGDVIWLVQSEVEEAAANLDQGRPLVNLSTLVPQRQAIWRAARHVSAPRMLPQLRLFGLDVSQLRGRRDRGAKGAILKGVAASPGSLTAPACLVHGPEDFAQMKTGEVLVAPLTTPAWTPLFARAGAVVTDVGGPLSHGSIVAREYGIPAVLGTGAATTRIRMGQRITVNGSEGLVILG